MSTFDLSIADLRFSVGIPSGFAVEEHDPLYLPFLNLETPTNLGIDITISCGPEPDWTSLPLLFDTQETWTAHRLGSDILLRMPNASEPGYLWTVLLTGDFKQATVYCSPLMIEDPLNAPGLITNPIHYPLDQILAMFHFSAHRGLIIHAAGVARGDSGVFCAGRSGAGKTTLMRQWRDVPDLMGLSDDRVVLREIDGRFRLFGTPWAGEGKVASPLDTDLHALAFVHHGDKNEIRPIAPRAALEQLLPTSSVLWFDPTALDRTLTLCHDLVQTIPAYEVCCRPDPSAATLVNQLLG